MSKIAQHKSVSIAQCVVKIKTSHFYGERLHYNLVDIQGVGVMTVLNDSTKSRKPILNHQPL